MEGELFGHRCRSQTSSPFRLSLDLGLSLSRIICNGGKSPDQVCAGFVCCDGTGYQAELQRYLGEAMQQRFGSFRFSSAAEPLSILCFAGFEIIPHIDDVLAGFIRCRGFWDYGDQHHHNKSPTLTVEALITVLR